MKPHDPTLLPFTTLSCFVVISVVTVILQTPKFNYQLIQLSFSMKMKSSVECFSSRFWALALKNAPSPQKALALFSNMNRNNVAFDSFSILFTLKSCTRLRNLSLFQHLHTHVLKLGFHTHVYVATSLLKAYVVVSVPIAWKLFEEIPDRNTVTWNTMVSGYSRIGDFQKAQLLFDKIPCKDVASWSAMIAGYINVGRCQRGLSIFRDMVGDEIGLVPDQVTVGSILSGCAQIGSLGLLGGKSIHGFIVKNGWKLNVELGTVLVDMYAKCGLLKNSCKVFHLMQERNVISWTVIICGLAQHGFSHEALSVFKLMEKSGVKPNEMTFTGILSACAQTGLVEEGRRYFNVIELYGMEPRIQHYGCMVDLLGKAGMLAEAYEMIKTMKFEPNVIIWGSYLSACREHKQFAMAERVIEHVLSRVTPENDGGVYTLICDLFVIGEKWDEAERVRRKMLTENVRKVRGTSFVRAGFAKG